MKRSSVTATSTGADQPPSSASAITSNRLGGRRSEQETADIAASAQEAIVDALVQKTTACAEAHGIPHVYLAGGVAANGRLRERFAAECDERGMTYHAPLLRYCTDNGAMIAYAGWQRLRTGQHDDLRFDIRPRWSLHTRHS